VLKLPDIDGADLVWSGTDLICNGVDFTCNDTDLTCNESDKTGTFGKVDNKIEKTEAKSEIGTLAGLAGSTAGAISGFLTSWIGTSYGGEKDYTDADATLSKDNIADAAKYLTTQAANTCDIAKKQDALTAEYDRKVIDVWEKKREDLLAMDKKNVYCWEDAFFRVFYTGT